MATTKCIDCPSSCLGHDLSDLCIYHEDTGESLRSIINDLPSGSSTETATSITTDDVISKAMQRNSSSMCASKIVDREFTYSLSSSQTSTTFSWNLSTFSANLPSGYQIATVRVRAVGNSSSGNNVIADSSSLSSGLTLSIDQYPVTVDFVIRITAACGNIDMEKSVVLTNPAATGKFRATLSAQDLNPQTQETDLTSYLNGMDSDLLNLSVKVEDLEEINGESTKTKVVNNSADITTLQTTVDDPSSFEISYTNNGASKEDSLTDIVTDLYSKIKELEDLIYAQQARINTLEAAT